MPKERISTEQEYEREVNDFIIKNGFRKMPMEAFLFGYNLYHQGKESCQELAATLLEFLIDADVKMKTSDDAFQVIDMQESLALEKEQHNYQR